MPFDAASSGTPPPRTRLLDIDPGDVGRFLLGLGVALASVGALSVVALHLSGG